MRIVNPEEVPSGIVSLFREHPEQIDAWAIDEETGTYWTLKKVSSYGIAHIQPKVPKGVDPKDVVSWYDLPTWIKGSYRSEDHLRALKSRVWVRGNLTTYFAYTAGGQYLQMYEQE